ncbi:MAG: transporter substrate-binding domain-containing protein [Magnetospirillum sp.]|nr:transporter substrate-binding domain-containing protein [Magnetospirillum sp.]
MGNNMILPAMGRWVAGILTALAMGSTICLSDTAWASPARMLEYAYPDQSIWTTRLDKNGEPDNPLLRLAESIFTKAGIPWRGKSYPAARLFNNLQDGTADFSMLVKSANLEACCLASHKPVASTELRAYRRSDTPPIRAREDLAGKDIITIHGYTYAGLLSFIKDQANKINNNGTVSHDSAFTMLEHGRADYVLDYAGPATEILAAHPIKGLEYDVIDRLDVHLILARSYPDAEAVMARLEAIAQSVLSEKIPTGK